MGRSQETFNKKDVRTKKEKKRKEKFARKLAKKENEKKGDLEDMIMYLDENGNFSDTPPDPTKKKKEIDSESISVSTPRMENVEVDPIRKGVVTFFNDSKGFGFIKDSETQESVFVHINNVIDEIKENNMVNYEVEMGMKGPTATNVKIFKELPKTAVKPAEPKEEVEGESAEGEVKTEPKDEVEGEKAEGEVETKNEEKDKPE
jgi:cold shock CspA family protein